MNFIRALLLVTVLFFNNHSSDAQIIEDTVMYAKDSAVELATNQTTLFFQEAEKTKTTEKTILITKAKKTLSLKKFLNTLNGGIIDAPLYADHGFADLDGDGKTELLIWNFTGGAHCCDEIYIFKNIAANKYQHAAKMFAGHTVINEKNEFEYNLNENFGYFFTCYACGYADTSDAAPIDVSSIPLRYKTGKLVAIPGDTELKSIINDNLAKLGEQPFVKVNNADFDEGLRKEFAFNLARYYYSFNKSMAATQQLFNKYYKYPDAKKVWASFVKQLAYMKSKNDF
jgi:hypothetical protein